MRRRGRNDVTYMAIKWSRLMDRSLPHCTYVLNDYFYDAASVNERRTIRASKCVWMYRSLIRFGRIKWVWSLTHTYKFELDLTSN